MNQEYIINVEEYESVKSNISEVLNTEQIKIIDNYIINSLTHSRKKTLAIIFQVVAILKENNKEIINSLSINELALINQRINYLVDNKQITAYGDTRAVRFSELTLN